MMPRPYRIVARIKNNRLWMAILARWPEVKTQSDAARRLDISASELGGILNLQRSPWDGRYNPGHWTPTARRIEVALRETCEYLFDKTLYGRPAQRIELEIDRPMLEAAGLLALPPSPAECYEAKELPRLMAEVLSRSGLTPRELVVLEKRYGEEGLTLSDIGLDLDVTTERIRQIEAKALRKLRHPSRSKELRIFMYKD